MAFALHPRLHADTRLVGDLPLSRLLLMDQAQVPWCVLVPRRPDLSELHELPESDQAQLMREFSYLGRFLMDAFSGHKLNVAALGNLVPQLHLHVIVRLESDAAWPQPVWGRLAARAYTEPEARERIVQIRRGFAGGRGAPRLELP